MMSSHQHIELWLRGMKMYAYSFRAHCCCYYYYYYYYHHHQYCASTGESWVGCPQDGYGSENLTVSLTKTKNWSGRNEVTENCGRLHPLWPQNKWLHTPRTTDYRHTRQGRWIQTELAFTLAKNASKPNPFEIIPLQTTRKENNWKTEEALVRAAVILETERIKGFNPWCLWWWWLSSS